VTAEAPLLRVTGARVTVETSTLPHAAVADVDPSEESRSFLLQLYSAWEAQDCEALRDMGFDVRAWAPHRQASSRFGRPHRSRTRSLR
jgi:hypothetical protein